MSDSRSYRITTVLYLLRKNGKRVLFFYSDENFSFQDESLSGVLTILCNHSFHGDCLIKWGDSW
jgi:hypothetical protein